jgi:hypothetical protein
MEKSFLNVGGGSKAIEVPDYLAGYRHDLLDIDPACNPDICLDARLLHTLPGGAYDVIYCSHNLEHYHRHHAIEVARGFYHMLRPDGFTHINVPNLMGVIQHVAKYNLDIDDPLYEFAGSKILVRDVIYGWSREIERSGQDFYSHKTGFSAKALSNLLRDVGFAERFMYHSDPFNLGCIAFKQPATADQKRIFGMK